MAKCLYREWFVNFRYPGHENVPTADSELGLIPENWSVRRMDEVADVVDCLHSKKPESTELGAGILLQLFNIGSGGVLNLTQVYRISASDYRQWITRIELRSGDCVVTNVGRIAAVAQIPPQVRAASGRNMTAIRPRSLPPSYLLQYLLSEHMEHEVQKKKDAGAIMDALNVKGIVKLNVPMPSHDLLARFELLARPIRERNRDSYRRAAQPAAHSRSAPPAPDLRRGRRCRPRHYSAGGSRVTPDTGSVLGRSTRRATRNQALRGTRLGERQRVPRDARTGRNPRARQQVGGLPDPSTACSNRTSQPRGARRGGRGSRYRDHQAAHRHALRPCEPTDPRADARPCRGIRPSARWDDVAGEADRHRLGEPGEQRLPARLTALGSLRPVPPTHRPDRLRQRHPAGVYRAEGVAPQPEARLRRQPQRLSRRDPQSLHPERLHRSLERRGRPKSDDLPQVGEFFSEWKKINSEGEEGIGLAWRQ